MKVEVSNGELIDKITILEIKQSQIQDPEKLENVKKELSILIEAALDEDLHSKIGDDLYKQLLEVNMALWITEDSIRKLEGEQTFDEEFVKLARSVYILNDERSRIKRRINETTSSILVEEKSYASYDGEVSSGSDSSVEESDDGDDAVGDVSVVVETSDGDVENEKKLSD
jgi:hypothetical protein